MLLCHGQLSLLSWRLDCGKSHNRPRTPRNRFKHSWIQESPGGKQKANANSNKLEVLRRILQIKIRLDAT